MKIANDVIKAVTDNYGYHFASWQPERIKNAVSKVDQVMAGVLDYSDANALAQSLANALKYDITNLLVNNKYPVWVDLIKEDSIEPASNLLVITYVAEVTDSLQDSLARISEYAHSVNADFVFLSGRTQGSLELEIFRIKKYVEAYDRTIFIDVASYIKDDCPNLFDIVPEDKVGIHDCQASLLETHQVVKLNKHRRVLLLKADFFQRHNIIESHIEYNLKYESQMMNTCYDNSVVVCSKTHSSLWNPITFPFTNLKDDAQRWMEISLYREGHDVYALPSLYNQNCLVIHEDIKQLANDESKILNYNKATQYDNVLYTWFYDNNIVGYKEKDPIDMMQFKILVLTHKEDQRTSIEKRGYLDFIDLNSIGSKFDNSFTESRIYYLDFEYLFPENAQYVGLVTGSWNLKYIQLNPIDQLHNWQSIRNLNNPNTLLCSNIETVGSFFGNHRTVLREVFKNISPDQIKEFLTMINLDVSLLDKNNYTGVSNQIIAKRDIVKSLFKFYQDNEILDKISFFMDKYDFEINERAYGGDAYARRSGFFSETATALWMAQNNFTLMPQEMLKAKWYNWKA
jgi:hypothetical protein